MNWGEQMTHDERTIAAVETRIRSTFKDGEKVGEISQSDLDTLLNSRLAWKYTAKCFAAQSTEPR